MLVWSVNGYHSWRSVLEALSPLRAQMLGFACSRNYLELWPTVKNLLQPKEKSYTFRGLGIVLSTLYGWAGFFCHPMSQIRELRLGDLPKVTQ